MLLTDGNALGANDGSAEGDPLGSIDGSSDSSDGDILGRLDGTELGSSDPNRDRD